MMKELSFFAIKMLTKKKCSVEAKKRPESIGTKNVLLKPAGRERAMRIISLIHS